jgi:hypothetical protein
MTSGFLYVVACVRISFLFNAEYIPLCVYTIFCLFCSFAERHLGCFYLLSILKNAAMNMGAGYLYFQFFWLYTQNWNLYNIFKCTDLFWPKWRTESSLSMTTYWAYYSAVLVSSLSLWHSTWDYQLTKKNHLFWLMDSKVSVCGLSCVALGLWQHSTSWWKYTTENAVHLMAAGKQNRDWKWLGSQNPLQGYSLQWPNFLPLRPYLLKAPHFPIAPWAGDQGFSRWAFGEPIKIQTITNFK